MGATEKDVEWCSVCTEQLAVRDGMCLACLERSGWKAGESEAARRQRQADEADEFDAMQW